MVTFNIDPARTALLVVDLQRVFVDGSPVAAPDGPAVLRRLNQLAAYCRQRGIRVIHTRHVVRPDHSNAGLLAEVVPAVAQGVIDDGTVSAELHPELDVVPAEFFSVERSLEARRAPGSPARAQVQSALAAARAELERARAELAADDA